MAAFVDPIDPGLLGPSDGRASVDDRTAMQLFHVPHCPFGVERVAASADRPGDVRMVVRTSCADVY